MDFGGQMHDLSQQTGVAVDELIILRQALDETGVGAGRAMFIINMMQRNLANLSRTKAGTEVIKDLGLNMAAISKLSPVAKLEALGQALGKITDPQKKMDAMMRLFGRGGFVLRGFFADPNALKDVAKALGSFPAFIAKNAEAFDRMGDKMSRIKYIGLGFFAGILEGIGPMLEMITDMLNKIDLTKIGQEIGRAVLFIVDLFKEGNVGEFLKLSFMKAFAFIQDNWKKVFDFMRATISVLGTLLTVELAKGINAISPKIAKQLDVPNNNILKGMEEDALSLFGKIGEAWTKSGGFVTNGPEFKKYKEALDDLILSTNIRVSDRILDFQGSAKTSKAGGAATPEGFVNKYAGLALKGSVEAYRAELGIGKKMSDIVTNTAETAEASRRTAAATEKELQDHQQLEMWGEI